MSELLGNPVWVDEKITEAVEEAVADVRKQVMALQHAALHARDQLGNAIQSLGALKQADLDAITMGYLKRIEGRMQTALDLLDGKAADA